MGKITAIGMRGQHCPEIEIPDGSCAHCGNTLRVVPHGTPPYDSYFAHCRECRVEGDSCKNPSAAKENAQELTYVVRLMREYTEGLESGDITLFRFPGVSCPWSDRIKEWERCYRERSAEAQEKIKERVLSRLNPITRQSKVIVTAGDTVKGSVETFEEGQKVARGLAFLHGMPDPKDQVGGPITLFVREDRAPDWRQQYTNRSCWWHRNGYRWVEWFQPLQTNSVKKTLEGLPRYLQPIDFRV